MLGLRGRDTPGGPKTRPLECYSPREGSVDALASPKLSDSGRAERSPGRRHRGSCEVRTVALLRGGTADFRVVGLEYSFSMHPGPSPISYRGSTGSPGSGDRAGSSSTPLAIRQSTSSVSVLARCCSPCAAPTRPPARYASRRSSVRPLTTSRRRASVPASCWPLRSEGRRLPHICREYRPDR